MNENAIPRNKKLNEKRSFIKRHTASSPQKVYLGSGIRYEISDFVRAINGDQKNAYRLTRGESIAMAGVYEKFLAERNDK